MDLSKAACGVCKARNHSSLANVWCLDCEETLCSKCLEHHDIFKATKDHHTIPIENFQALPKFVTDINTSCNVHNEKYQYYCPNHEKPICKLCVATTHKNCNDAKALDEVVQNAKSSVRMKNINENLIVFAKEISNVLKDTKDNISTIKDERIVFQRKISTTRERINRHFDKIEKDLLSKMDSKVNLAEENLNGMIQKVEARERGLNELQDGVDNMKLYASELQTFFCLEELEKQVQIQLSSIKDIFDKGNLYQITLEFSLNKKLNDIPSSIIEFGDVSIVTSKTECTMMKEEMSKAQVKRFSIKQTHTKIDTTKKMKVAKAGPADED